MATYEITAPNGEVFEITAPDSATEQEVMAYAQSQFKAQPSVPSKPVAQPAPQQESALMRYGVRPAAELAGAVIEPLATMATGAVGKIAGDVAGLVGIPAHALAKAIGYDIPDPSSVKSGIQEAVQYRPRTELGKMTTAPIEAIGGAISSAADVVTAPIENEYLRAGAKEALMQAPSLYGAKTIPKAISKAASQKAMAAPRIAAKAAGEKIGMIPPPEGGIVRRTMYSTGRASDAVSLRNQQKATSAIAKDVGLPENAPITPELISERRAILNKSYDEFAGAFPTGIKISNSFSNKMKARLADVQQKLTSERETFKELEGVPNVLEEQIAKASNVRDAQGVIDSISALRAKSDAAYLAGNKKSAKIFRDIADGYESAMATQLKSTGNFSLFNKFENSRKQLAKLHFVEKVIDPVSNLVDFGLIRNQSGSSIAKAKYLSGETKTVADFARQFPTATKRLTPEQAATLGKWEVTVPLAATAGAMSAGAGAGMMMGAPVTGAIMTAIPAAIGTAAPMLGQAGLLRRTASFSPTKKVAATGLLGVSPYVTNEEQ